MFKKIVTSILTFFLIFSICYADSVSPLPADKAFALSAYLDQDSQLILEWNIAPGYYLYRNQLKLGGVGKVQLPTGQLKHDMLHGNYQAYMGVLKIPVTSIITKRGVLHLNIDYQGCSSAGFCYTPIKKVLKIKVSSLTHPQNLNQYVESVGENVKKTAESSNDDILKFFDGRHLLFILFSFLGLGLLLAFTPCVLPMVPILSGIIVGQGKKQNKKKSFFLSLAYVSGMAMTYAIAGVVIALIGSSIQAELQKPWVIVLFSGVFVLLALSLFGFFELQLPARFQRQVTELSNKQRGGHYIGVFLMGCLSTLIVSPCVSAPLVGVLAYIGQTGDVVLGALALLALGIGMGIPLLLIGISADKILPKAGPWMTLVERIFGFVMLGLAIWMLSRMIPGPISLALWATLFVVSAIYLAVFSVPLRIQWFTKGVAVAALVYGIILMVGALEGNDDIFYPWAEFKTSAQMDSAKSVFKVIHSMDELEQEWARAKSIKQPVLLDFYADWCNSCVIMDRTVFSKEDVQAALENKIIVLRVDLTKNDAFDRAIQKRFHVVGPPTIIFFNSQGQELTSLRIVGEVNAKKLLMQLEKIK